MTTRLVLDDIIYRLQRFGGATEFWRALSDRLADTEDLSIRHVNGSSLGRFSPVVTKSTEILHSSHFRVPAQRNRRCVTTIHDLTFERGMLTGRSAQANLWLRRRAVRRSSAIVCISDFTRNELLEVYADAIPAGVDVTTIHHGRTYDGPEGRQLDPSDTALCRGYVLYVGTRLEYKNFSAAIRAFARSGLERDGYQLWCTGPAESGEDRRLIEQSGAGDGAVRFLGTVGLERLATLYENAVALIYPSRYEGFGLPPLDAMSLGCPVVASDSSSVAEVVSGGGILVHPDDIDGFASALGRMADPDEHERLRRDGLRRASDFSWDDAAAAYARVYRSLSP